MKDPTASYQSDLSRYLTGADAMPRWQLSSQGISQHRGTSDPDDISRLSADIELIRI